VAQFRMIYEEDHSRGWLLGSPGTAELLQGRKGIDWRQFRNLLSQSCIWPHIKLERKM